VQSPLVSRVGLVRLQSCFIQRKEIVRVVGYLKEHYPTNYSERFLNLEEEAARAGQAAVANGTVAASLDPAEEAKYQGIKEWVMGQEYMSMSRIQGECAVGFNRARRFLLACNKKVLFRLMSKLTAGAAFYSMTPTMATSAFQPAKITHQ
ncbi:MAG: hypothetical protein PHU89_02865, partial [Bacilli bacterium]|nr:hypothetical protein [Bacilli bacterium]